MKRLLALSAIIGSIAVASGPALAATNSYGSFKASWTVAVTSTVHVHTNVNTAGAYVAGANSLSPDAADPGVCASGTESSDDTLTFGTVAPAGATTTGCNYRNAVGVSVTTNDSAGFKIQEMLDAAMPAGYTLCALPNSPAAFGGALSLTTLVSSARVGTIACGGSALTPGTGGALVNAGAGGGDFGGAGESYQGATGGSLLWASNAGPAAGLLASEDIQLNMAANAASGANSAVVTVQYIAN
ncbi:MAG: hypothetical protein M3126_00985 [Candidatus Eremiobacteraeota bacterium]|nr:hypothetical protein [Candidatus Eremiobacteraeota bacterium]